MYKYFRDEIFTIVYTIYTICHSILFVIQFVSKVYECSYRYDTRLFRIIKNYTTLYLKS